MPGATLVRPPPVDTSKSPIETVLELRTLSDIGPVIIRYPEKYPVFDIVTDFYLKDIFTNARELWHPPGARGIYGGAVIAQCLAAAQETVPPPSSANNHAVYLVHSMHCYFVLAGDASIPVLYHVERVRDGKSFLTRTVQARQRGKCIFTTTLSFMLEGSGGESTVDHGADLPNGVIEGLGKIIEGQIEGEDEDSDAMGVDSRGPFVSKILGIADNESPYPHQRRPQAWVKSRGSISPSGGQHAHLSALAYMSDSWFIGTVSRVHGLTRAGHATYQRQFPTPEAVGKRLPSESKNTFETPKGASIGMMVSLDHIIYFHRPREVKADDWICSEMQTPWSGQGRGLVEQRIWNKEGRLVATCYQEGLVRLQQAGRAGSKSKL